MTTEKDAMALAVIDAAEIRCGAELAAAVVEARAHLASRIAELEAELAAVREDAERLDWLERTKRGTLRMDFLDLGSILGLVPRYLHWGEGNSHATLRAAIDAAREGK